MFKLAHISDVHLGPLPPVTTRELMSKRITGYLNWKKNRSKNATQDIVGALVKYHAALSLNHTVITGDLINLGLNLEYGSFVFHIHEGVCAKVDFNHKDKIYTRPRTNEIGVKKWSK